MRITAFDGDSALNTTLPLPDAEIGINIILDGWNFNVTPTTDQRNQVSLTMSLTVVFTSQDNGKIIFNQQFFAQKDFYEIPKANYIMSRDARVYILHEECIDKIFASITSPSTRSALYEGH
jgi:predicted P-loop ATPase/GTPase